MIAQSGPPSGVVPSSARSEVPTDGGLNWQRSAGESAPFVSPPPTVTVIRGMEPKAKEPSLEDVVRTACQGARPWPRSSRPARRSWSCG